VLRDEVSIGLADSIRDGVIKHVDQDTNAQIQWQTNMLEVDPAFSDAVALPAALAIVNRCLLLLPLVESRAGAVPVDPVNGSVVIWNGAVWHAGLARKTPGERVVLHMTYTRLGVQSIENHDHLKEDWFHDKPCALTGLFGREYFFGRSATGKHNDSFALKEKTIRTVYRSENARAWLGGETE
jgi:hypothetical protein